VCECLGHPVCHIVVLFIRRQEGRMKLVHCLSGAYRFNHHLKLTLLLQDNKATPDEVGESGDEHCLDTQRDLWQTFQPQQHQLYVFMGRRYHSSHQAAQGSPGFLGIELCPECTASNILLSVDATQRSSVVLDLINNDDNSRLPPSLTSSTS